MNILTIDIGNTTINIGAFLGKKLALSFKIPTGQRSSYSRAIAKGLNKGRIKANSISKIVLCSVVPKETSIVEGVLKRLLGAKTQLVGRDIKIPIVNKYKNPKQVGQDRLVNAYVGLKLYGPGLILVDFGTAITFDIVSKQSEYLGGLIFPGLDLSLEALNKKTALLPKISVKNPKSLLGRDTVSSINNGTVFGMAGACDGVISRLQKKYRGYKIITTGGNVGFIKKYSKKIKVIRPHLTLEGLRFLSEE